MPTRRQIQVADQIQQIISVLLQRDMKDPRIGFVTVTQVEITQDLKYARVFVSVMGTPEEQRDTMAALASGKGFMRRELASRLEIRAVPELQFKLDRGVEYSDRINRLLNDLKTAEIVEDAATDEALTPNDTDASPGSDPEQIQEPEAKT